MEKSARVSVRHPGVQRIVEATECSGIEDKYPGTDSGEADSGLSFPEHFMMHLALLCHRGSGARWRSPRRKKAVSLHVASGATACTVSIPPGCTVQYLKECIADATSVLPVLLQVRELSQRRAVDGTRGRPVSHLLCAIFLVHFGHPEIYGPPWLTVMVTCKRFPKNDEFVGSNLLRVPVHQWLEPTWLWVFVKPEDLRFPRELGRTGPSLALLWAPPASSRRN